MADQHLTDPDRWDRALGHDATVGKAITGA
jgi:hypothetical protein